jgi:protein SCO1/2
MLASQAPTSAAAAAPHGAPASASARGGGGAIGRLIARPPFWIVLLSVLFTLPLLRTALRRLPPAPPALSTLPTFTMTDQLGQPFGTKELEGKVWVADFIFTSCPTACPLLTRWMSDIEQRAKRLGPEFHLVSFTVDPGRDSPARLAAYAATYKVDPRKWSFLTGPLADVERAVIDGFKIGIDRHKTVEDFWEIVHGEHLVLVDRHLRIRGYFQASSAGRDQLLAALGRVANEGPDDEPPPAPPVVEPAPPARP